MMTQSDDTDLRVKDGAKPRSTDKRANSIESIAKPRRPAEVIAMGLRSAGRSFRRAIRPALPAILLYYAIQAVAAVVLMVMSAEAGLSATDILGAWDGGWLRSISEGGYNQPITVHEDGRPAENNLAFFPLYPALTALAMTLGVPPLKAALLVTVIAGGLLAWGLYVLGTHVAGARAGTLLVGIVAMAPGSVVLHMAYTEATFLAIAVWALVAILRENWFLAAALISFAGLTRVTAVALIAALGVAVFIATMRGRGGWRPWLAVVAAPLGLLCYLGYVAWRVGRVDGWFWLQSGAWQTRFDFGAFTWERITVSLTAPDHAWVTLVTMVVVAAIVLLIWSCTAHLPPTLYVYSTVVMVTALSGSEHWQSTPRMLLPALLVLAVPLAIALAKLRGRDLAVLLPAGALAGGWFAAYMLTAAQVYP